jgi:phosphate transport system substrate-binding protein
MKKTLVCLLAIIMLIMSAACGKTDGTTNASGSTNDSAQSNNSYSSTNDSAQSNNNSTSNNDSTKSNDSISLNNNTVQAADSIDTNSNTAPVTDNFDISRVIAVFTREEGSGTRDAFVGITGVGEDMYVEAVVESETNQILTKVEENKYAISYVSVGSLNSKVKALEINGISPSAATIVDGSYMLQRPFLVCLNADNESNPLAQDFIAFILSAAGQDIVGTKWTSIVTGAPAYGSHGLSGTLKVGGSTSVEPLMQALSQSYKTLNPGVDIEISGGGSGTGISEATSGVINIGMSSRALKDSEKEALAGYDIALDGVAVIVNPANPVNSMTIEQVREIFTGETTRWDQTNG